MEAYSDGLAITESVASSEVLMNTKRTGDITEVETQLAFMKAGYTVLIPYGDCDPYDLVVDLGDRRFLRVQCKIARRLPNGTMVVEGKSSHRRNGKFVLHKYSCDDIDCFATVVDGNVLLIPISEVDTSIAIRTSETKNGISKGVHWAKDYELLTIIDKLKGLLAQ